MVRAGPGTAKLLFFARWLLPSRWRAVKEIKNGAFSVCWPWLILAGHSWGPFKKCEW